MILKLHPIKTFLRSSVLIIKGAQKLGPYPPPKKKETKLDSLCFRNSCEHVLVVCLTGYEAKINGHTIQKSSNVDGNTIKLLEEITMSLKISFFF